MINSTASTLRVSGDVIMNQNLSDGVNTVLDPEFFVDKQQLRKDASWSYRIAAGTDKTSADPLAVTAGTGDVKLGAGVIARTGTGDIDIVAGRDIKLADNTSAIYTLGALPTAWAVNVGKFRQGIGALGGGDVAVNAGQDINDLSVTVATTGKQLGDNSYDEITGTSTVGSNDVFVSSGDIRGGQFYLAQGGSMRAAGAITPSINPIRGIHFAPMLALGDTRFKVSGGTGVELETVVNPTILPQSRYQVMDGGRCCGRRPPFSDLHAVLPSDDRRTNGGCCART